MVFPLRALVTTHFYSTRCEDACLYILKMGRQGSGTGSGEAKRGSGG